MILLSGSFHCLAQEGEIEIPLILTIEELYTYEISCKLNGSNAALIGVQSEELKQILSHWLDEENFALWDSSDHDSYISPEDLEPWGLGLKYDPILLQLSLEIPYDQRQPQRLFLSGNSKSSAVEADSIRPEIFSSYLNLWGSHKWEVQEESDTNTWYHQYSLEQILSLYQWNVRIEEQWNSELQWGQPELTLSRDLSFINSRIQIGHYYPEIQGFQRSGQYQGISISYIPDILNSDNSWNTVSKEIILESPAMVEVWVNNRMVKELPLTAGKYRLRDFPIYSGINDIELIIHYQNGNVETLKYNQPFQSQLIKEGEQRFHYSMGISPWSTDRSLFSFFHQYGLSNTLNLGFNFQSDLSNMLGGIQGKWASPLGIWVLDSALAFENYQYQSWAIHGTYKLLINSNPLIPQIGYSLGYQSPEFQQIESNQTEWNSSLFINQKIFRFSTASFNLNYQYRPEFKETQWLMSGRLAIPFSERVQCGLSFKTDLQSPSLENSRVQLLFQLKDTDKNISTNINQNLLSSSTTLDVQKKLPSYGIDLSASANMPGKDEKNQASIQSGISLDHHRIQSSATISAQDPSEGLLPLSGSLQYGSAVVMAGKYITLSAPIYDSFALVIPRNQLKDRRIGVNPGPRYESQNDLWGIAPISSLSSYKSKELSIELLDFRQDDILLMDQKRILLRPYWRSGSLVFIGNPPTINVKMTLINNEEPAEFFSGTLIDEKGEHLFFTDQEGVAYIYGIQEGTLTMKVPGYKDILISSFTIDSEFHDGGIIYLEKQSGGTP